MRRTSVMAMGFVLVFLGVQLNLVETYVLTPRFSSFLSEHAEPTSQSGFRNNGLVNRQSPMVNPNTGLVEQQNNSPFYQASFPNGAPINQPMMTNFSTPKVVTPPSWMCWPVLFLGTVVFLHGFSMKRE